MNAFRMTLFGGCALALLPIAVTRAMAATAASTLFESTPFILAGIILRTAGVRHSSRWSVYLGCGCAGGPAARSLPAFAAACAMLGPAIAGARFAAALVAARWLSRRSPSCSHEEDATLSALSQLTSMLPIAFAASLVMYLGGRYEGVLAQLGPVPGIMAGAAAGFALAPCGLGAVGLAASLRATAPFAAVGFLSVAGIADARSLYARKTHRLGAGHDALAYGMAGFACAIVAARHGQTLLHPHFTAALWMCALAFGMLAARRRRASEPRERWAPAIMLVAALIAPPPPVYVATETTLSDAFPGERIAFTGMLVRTRHATSVVRYAITCCRADAAPIALRLDGGLPRLASGWITVRGTLVRAGDGLRLRVAAAHASATPVDPYIYR